MPALAYHVPIAATPATSPVLASDCIHSDTYDGPLAAVALGRALCSTVRLGILYMMHRWKINELNL